MPDARELAVADALATALYEVVPEHYSTYCALISRIAADVFRHFNIATNLVPCQLWHNDRGGNHVLGFVGVGDKPGVWDGHVVCLTSTILFDGALSSMRRDFKLDVPPAVIVPRYTTPSHVMAGRNLDGKRRLWWIGAPFGFDTTPPLQPVELIAEYSAGLVTMLKQRLGKSPPARRVAA